MAPIGEHITGIETLSELVTDVQGPILGQWHSSDPVQRNRRSFDSPRAPILR